jgi:hypothetical protein
MGMHFHDDPKWTEEERFLHKEKWIILKSMDKLIYTNSATLDEKFITERKYQILAKRYHEIERILDDESKC